MSESAAKGRITERAYLVMERQAAARSEYVQGVCTALDSIIRPGLQIKGKSNDR